MGSNRLLALWMTRHFRLSTRAAFDGIILVDIRIAVSEFRRWRRSILNRHVVAVSSVPQPTVVLRVVMIDTSSVGTLLS